MQGLAEALGLWATGNTVGPDVIRLLINGLIDSTTPLEERANALDAISRHSQSPGQLNSWIEVLLEMSTPCGVTGRFNGKPVLDCAGTGGSGVSMLNASTAAMFVLASMGVVMVKHGNRGVTRKSGSADVLEKLGISIQARPEDVPLYLNEVGAVFLFAPNFHPAFKQISTVRQLLSQQGKSSLFNLMGPLLNPARPAVQLTGVVEKEHLELYADLLGKLKRERYLVVLGRDAVSEKSLGEISVSGPNEFRSNISIEQWPIVRIDNASLEEIIVQSAEESARRIEAILENKEQGFGREFILANVCGAYCTYNPQVDYTTAYELAQEAIRSGKAKAVLEKWKKLSQQLGSS